MENSRDVDAMKYCLTVKQQQKTNLHSQLILKTLNVNSLVLRSSPASN